MTQWMGLLDGEGVEIASGGYARQAYRAGCTVTFTPAQDDWGVVAYAALYPSFVGGYPSEVVDLNITGPQVIRQGDYAVLRLHMPSSQASVKLPATAEAPAPPDPDVDADGFNWRTGRYE